MSRTDSRPMHGGHIATPHASHGMNKRFGLEPGAGSVRNDLRASEPHGTIE